MFTRIAILIMALTAIGLLFPLGLSVIKAAKRRYDEMAEKADEGMWQTDHDLKKKADRKKKDDDDDNR